MRGKLGYHSLIPTQACCSATFGGILGGFIGESSAA